MAPDHQSHDGSGPLLGDESLDSAPDILRQNLADQDQTQADVDQTLSDRDQTSSDRDQLASDADQAAADRDQAQQSNAGASDLPDYHVARVQRLSGTAIRHATRGERMATSTGRDLASARRDQNAEMRDRLARRQDLEEIRTQAGAVVDPEAAREALLQLSVLRNEAATDREEAAAFRVVAAEKRRVATRKRLEANELFRMANQSDIDGVLYRGAGDLALESRFITARDAGIEMHLVCVGVDGIGAADGDRDLEALKAVAAEIRSRLPEGAPVVSAGRTDFAFTVDGIDAARVIEDMAKIDSVITASNPELRVAVAVVQMVSGETFPLLMERALRSLRVARVSLYEIDGSDPTG